MKTISLQEISTMLTLAKSKKRKGELFRVGSKRERNDALTAARVLGMEIITDKTEDGFRIIAP